MIVFTIKNSRSDTVYVGTTSKSIDECWTMYQLAKDAGIDAPLYNDMRQYGIACFRIEEYDYAESRKELVELFTEALEQNQGVSLKGMKTSLPRTAVYTIKEDLEVKPTETKTAVSKSMNGVKESIADTKNSMPQKKKPTEPSVLDKKPKLATGRTGSAIKEKRIKEAIALEKAARESLKKQQISEQADEMKAILAKLDSRGSTLAKRY